MPRFFHLFRYHKMSRSTVSINGKLTDAQRFDLAVKGIVGKRLTFGQLTGKQPDYATCSNWAGADAAETREAEALGDPSSPILLVL